MISNGRGDSDWWDTYQSIDDEIRALCVHENFDRLVRAIRTTFAKILLDRNVSGDRPNVSLSTAETCLEFVCTMFRGEILKQS